MKVVLRVDVTRETVVRVSFVIVVVPVVSVTLTEMAMRLMTVTGTVMTVTIVNNAVDVTVSVTEMDCVLVVNPKTVRPGPGIGRLIHAAGKDVSRQPVMPKLKFTKFTYVQKAAPETLENQTAPM